MGKPASEGKLGDLHDRVADVLIDNLESEIEGEFINKDDPDAKPVTLKKVQPALVACAVKFLKDNDITCVPAEGNKINDLKEKLAAKQRQFGSKVIKMREGTND